MKNITITVDEGVARKARIAAATSGKSLSRWIGDLVANEVGPDLAEARAVQIEALRRFLASPGWPGIAKDLPTRDELYDRPALRRHEHPDPRDGSGGTGKARKRRQAP